MSKNSPEISSSIFSYDQIKGWEKIINTYDKNPNKKYSPHAISWYKSAIQLELPLPIALTNLADCYLTGLNIDKNIAQAVKLYKLGAEKKYYRAQHRLGVLYQQGIGVDQNYQTAVMFFTAAARQKYAPAQYQLALCYEKGLGLAKDEKEAVKACQLAANQKHEPALIRLGFYFEKGIGGQKEPVKAFKLYQQAANYQDQDYNNWSPSGLFHMARCYQEGTGVEKCEEKATVWYVQAGALGHVEALYISGQLLEKTNPLKAMDCYRKAANLGHNDAKFQLGLCYETGITGQKNFKEALTWYWSAAQSGHLEAHRNFTFLKKVITENDQKSTSHSWFPLLSNLFQKSDKSDKVEVLEQLKPIELELAHR